MDVDTDPELYAQADRGLPRGLARGPGRQRRDASRSSSPWPTASPGTRRSTRSPTSTDRAWPPKMVNIKPSRFGPLSELFAAYDHCEANGIGAYGGGQWELGPGRGHIQYLASIFHPDTPNDVAPVGLQHRRHRARPARRARWSRSRRRPASAGADRPQQGYRQRRRRHPHRRVGSRPWLRTASPTRSTSRSRTSSPPPSSTSAAAVYYDSETLPQLAAFFYRQAVEERNHAMIMVQYLLDTDEEVGIPDIKSQQTRLRRRRRPGEDGARAGEAGQRRDQRPLQARARERRLPGRAVPHVVRQGAGRGGLLDDRPARRRRAGQGRPAAWSRSSSPASRSATRATTATAPPAAGGAL